MKRVDTEKCPLQWRHNGRDGVSNHGRLDGLLKRLFRRRSKKSSKLRVSGLCEGNSPVTGQFPHRGPVGQKMFPFLWRHHISDHWQRAWNRHWLGLGWAHVSCGIVLWSLPFKSATTMFYTGCHPNSLINRFVSIMTGATYDMMITHAWSRIYGHYCHWLLSSWADESSITKKPTGCRPLSKLLV